MSNQTLDHRDVFQQDDAVPTAAFCRRRCWLTCRSKLVLELQATLHLATEGSKMAVDDNEKVVAPHIVFLKRLLLAFWAAWLSLVFSSNLFDAVKTAGLLGESWLFASGNYHFLAETTARYGTPGWLNMLLFLGVICWEGVAALLFWLAFWTFRGREEGSTAMLYSAFTAGLNAVGCVSDRR